MPEPIIRPLLENAVAAGATDIHLVPGLPIMHRLQGELQSTDDTVLTANGARELCYSLLTDAQIAAFETDIDLDLIRTFGAKSLRVNLHVADESVGAVIRVLDHTPLPLEQLRRPNVVTRFCHRDKGLVLITGTRGQGKTTTLAAMVDYINRHYRKHIISIEDPIEYFHTNKLSVVQQREIGRDTRSFERGLRAALRMDPNVIVIGEMRDFDSIKIALAAAESGVLVLSTLHTMSIDKILEHVFSYVPSEKEGQIRMMLAESLLGVIHQELLPTVTGNKRVATEILVNTHAIRNLIRNHQTDHLKSYITMGQQNHEMRAMKASLDELFEAGEIDEVTYERTLRNYA